MSQTVGVTKAITNLNDVHNIFQLRQTAGPSFFREWSGPFEIRMIHHYPPSIPPPPPSPPTPLCKGGDKGG
ncbi:hypothetical protein LKE08_01320, partial [Lyngbya sp. CCY1209]|nr:hypothetical protein [Lyngbya sp. CCY1209]